MKYFAFLALFVSMYTWMACGHGRPVNETGTTETTQPAVPANSTTQPQTIPVDINPQTTSTAVIPSGGTGAGLNPEHGQPGHRCDIGVGEPLNSKPAAASVAPQTPAVTTTSPVTSPFTISSDKPTQPAATTAVAPGMNPEHGKPGHRCDIAVGAPLNSKPAEQSTSPVTAPATTPFTISADKPAQPAATTAVAPGMNPAHGQPGHRCDIAVGAPLNSPVSPNYTPPAAVNKEVLPKVVPIKPTQDTKKDNR